MLDDVITKLASATSSLERARLDTNLLQLQASQRVQHDRGAQVRCLNSVCGSLKKEPST